MHQERNPLEIGSEEAGFAGFVQPSKVPSGSFSVYRLRFRWKSAERVFFPAGKASNVVRGALGATLRGICCVKECHSAATCELRARCGYARIFEPVGISEGPSGFHDHPRPFVLRAAHLDGATFMPGEDFWFDVHLFLTLEPPLAYFVLAFSQLAESGLGPTRGRVRLDAVDVLAIDGSREARVFESGRFCLSELPAPIQMDLVGASDGPSDCHSVAVEFLTATELKVDGQIARRPEFWILVARIRDRLSGLYQFYGEAAPLELDWRGLVDRARAVRLVRWQLRDVKAERFSTKTRQVHSLGGFTGSATYEGELREFLPLLSAAEFAGVGRQTVWGKGALRVSLDSVECDRLAGDNP